MDAKTRFEKNTSLVYFLLYRYFTFLAHDEDIQQAGMLGLWKSCIRFDETKGYQFSTFAAKCIVNEVRISLRNQRKLDRLPTVNVDDYVDNGESESTISSLFLRDKDDHYRYSETMDIFNRVVSRYNDRNKKIISLYMNNVIQQDICKEVCCSQAQVSRIISKFKREMEEELYENNCG